MERKVQEKKNKSFTTELAGTIAMGIVCIQLKVAQFLQQLERRYSIRQKRIVLLVFLLLSTAYFMSLIYRSFSASDADLGKTKLIQPAPPMLPPPGFKSADTTSHPKK